MRVSNLRVESAGLPISDYRILESDLEFRSLDACGHSYPEGRSEWRRLSTDEIALHFRLNTVVSQWLIDKLTRSQSDEEGQHPSLRAA